MKGDGDDGAAVEPAGRGRLTLLVVILIAVVGFGALGVIGVVLSTRALRVVGSFAVHTQRIKVSPDGRWALVIDSSNEGALGGSTDVYLEQAGSKARTYTLHEADWLNDWEVRWLDARTVMLGGELTMPFIAESVDTGSAATSGAALDAAGYVPNEVAPGERVAMFSGLSVVPSEHAATTLLSRREAAKGLPFQELRAANGTTWPGSLSCRLLAVNDRGELPDPRIATAGRVIATSLGRRTEVRWDARSRWLIIHTRLRRRLIGFIWERNADVRNSAEAASRARALWHLFHVERIPPS